MVGAYLITVECLKDDEITEFNLKLNFTILKHRLSTHENLEKTRGHLIAFHSVFSQLSLCACARVCKGVLKYVEIF